MVQFIYCNHLQVCSAGMFIAIESRMTSPTSAAAKPLPSVVAQLAADLRQPLNSIEAIAYYLEMTLPADQLDAMQYLRRIRELIDEATRIVDKKSGVPRNGFERE
jgi:hypothetical protein